MKSNLFAIVAIVLFVFAINAQEEERTDGLTKKDIATINDFTVNIKSAELLCAEKPNVKLKVVFDQTLREIDRVSAVTKNLDLSARYQNSPAAYHLMNLKTGLPLEVGQITVFDNFVILVLTDPEPFKTSRKFSLFFRGMKLKEGTLTENASLADIAISSDCDEFPTALKTPTEITDKTLPGVLEYMKANFQPKASSPEVKISFEMNGERVTSPFYQTSIAAQPFELKRLGLRGAYSIVPVFLNLEKNDTPGVDLDKLIFGSKFNHLIAFNDDGKYATSRLRTSPLIGIKTELSFRMETTTKFKTGNLLLGVKSGLPINVLQTRGKSMRLTPFVGFDFGYKIIDDSSTDEARVKTEKWITRPFFGFEFFFTPARKETEIPYQFEASYVHRIFLRPEEVYKRDADRKPVIEGFTTNPKGYFSAQFTLWQNKFISPFIKYTYGRDVTQYLLEDHKYRIGLNANFDWGKKK